MNDFEKVVIAVADIAMGFRQGLQALGNNSVFVNVTESRLLDGSTDIDTCTRNLYPNAHRWDYVISYKGKAYYLEVHPATGGTVKEMESKITWLKCWLKQKATALDAYPSGVPRFSWVHSGKCGLSKTSTEYRRAAMIGLIPARMLNLE